MFGIDSADNRGKSLFKGYFSWLKGLFVEMDGFIDYVQSTGFSFKLQDLNFLLFHLLVVLKEPVNLHENMLRQF